MLSVSNRLRKRRDILFVLKNSVQLKGGLFRIRASKTQKGAEPRITVIISAKEAKKAVTRNAIKRRTREVIRKHLQSLRGYDILIFPSKSVNGAPFSELVKEFTHHADVLKDRSASY